MQWVEIHHPATGGTALVAASAVPHHLARGWQVAGMGEDTQPPARSASKAEWVEFAASHGIPREQAEQRTKDELIDQFTEEE